MANELDFKMVWPSWALDQGLIPGEHAVRIDITTHSDSTKKTMLSGAPKQSAPPGPSSKPLPVTLPRSLGGLRIVRVFALGDYRYRVEDSSGNELAEFRSPLDAEVHLESLVRKQLALLDAVVRGEKAPAPGGVGVGVRVAAVKRKRKIEGA